MEETKSEPFLVLLALFSISFQFGRIWTKLCGITHIASKRHILIIKGGRNEIWAFLSPLGASWRYFSFHCNLDETLWHYSYTIKTINLNHLRLKKTKSEPFLVSLALFSILFHFGRIWTNLDKTFWPYSWSLKIM